MQIYHSPRFQRIYKKLPSTLKLKVEEREEIFRLNPFDSRLDTHKLHGKYKGYWSFWITGPHRIMFDFSGKDETIFINIGDHDIYR